MRLWQELQCVDRRNVFVLLVLSIKVLEERVHERRCFPWKCDTGEWEAAI